MQAMHTAKAQVLKQTKVESSSSSVATGAKKVMNIVEIINPEVAKYEASLTFPSFIKISAKAKNMQGTKSNKPV